MSRGDGGDPLGKRALFSDPKAAGRARSGAPRSGGPGSASRRSGAPSSASPRSGAPREANPPTAGEVGRRVWYSRPTPLPSGPFVVDCPRCRTRSRLGWLALARQLVPSLWWPLKPRSRWMRCPACLEFGWCRVDLAGGRAHSH